MHITVDPQPNFTLFEIHSKVHGPDAPLRLFAMLKAMESAGIALHGDAHVVFYMTGANTTFSDDALLRVIGARFARVFYWWRGRLQRRSQPRDRA